MNLTKLFDTQRILDARIEKEHPRVEGEDRLAKKILALQVELGECANEWRGFKFWSKYQEPRKPFETTSGNGEVQGLYCNRCEGFFDHDHVHKKECAEAVIPTYTKNPLLEEYVDCLHFILSIGLEIGAMYFEYDEHHTFKEEDITNQFSRVMDYAIGLKEDDYCSELLQSFVYLGELLGFTWEKIEQAYYSKNAINHTRQDTGY